jgi:hypothetical protein
MVAIRTKIMWEPDDLPATMYDFGRGVGILGPAAAGEESRVIAFVEGLYWLHPGFEAVVRFDVRTFPTGPSADSLRMAIERLVRTGSRRLDGVLLPGFRIHING